MFKNTSSQKLIVFAFDSATNLPKSGDSANITAYVSKDYGTVTVLGDTSATEMDATNAKGYYLFDLTQAETNGDTLLFSAKSSTSGIVVVGSPATVFTLPASFTAFVTPTGATVAAVTGAVGSVTGAVGSVTGTVGSVTGSVGSIATGGITEASFATTAGSFNPLGIIDQGTAQSVSGTTIQLRSAASFDADSELVGATVLIATATTGAGQSRVITAYTNSTDTATVDTWTTTPTGTITYKVFASPPNSSAGTVSANVTKWNGTTVATPATAGIPDVNVKNINNVATTSVTTISANQGTTQPVNFTGTAGSALVKSDMIDAAGTAWGSGAITAASIASAAMNGKGDWNIGKTGYTVSTVSDKTGYTLSTAGLAAFFTTNSGTTYASAVSGSVVKEIVTNVSGGGGSDPWAIALPGSYSSGQAGNIVGTFLDAAISGRMATYSQPTGFLAATFPSGTVANTTNITAGTITTVTNLTNAPTTGDLTATMKTSVTTAATAATPNLNSAYNAAKTAAQAGDAMALTGDLTSTMKTSVTQAAQTTGYQKNAIAADIPVVMVDSADHVTRKTGLTLTVTRSIDGAAFGSATGTAAEIANGVYQFDASAADMNGTNIVLRFAASGADPVELHIKTYT